MPTAIKLECLVNEVVSSTLGEFADKNVQPSDLAISLIDLTDAQKADKQKDSNNNNKQKHKRNAAESRLTPAHYRGQEAIYPASIVKLFYLVAAHQWLADKKIIETDELKRACRDMIIDSSNDGTNYVLDVLTETTSGPELPEKEMLIWARQRNAINRYFAREGYKNINVNQKVWGDGPYGRERVFVGENFENRNKLTTNATACLLARIALRECVSAKHSDAMLALLARDFTKASENIDNQATGFFGTALPKTAKLWSKAGWMSKARHDAAYIELASGVHFVLVVFISNHAKEYWMLPNIAAKVIHALEALHKIS